MNTFRIRRTLTERKSESLMDSRTRVNTFGVSRNYERQNSARMRYCNGQASQAFRLLPQKIRNFILRSKQDVPPYGETT